MVSVTGFVRYADVNRRHCDCISGVSICACAICPIRNVMFVMISCNLSFILCCIRPGGFHHIGFVCALFSYNSKVIDSNFDTWLIHSKEENAISRLLFHSIQYLSKFQ